MEDSCTQCGNTYQILGSHWSRSSDCQYPDWSDELHEIATGLLMGDGYLSLGNNTPRIEVKMITPEYLTYLDNIFGNQATGVDHYMTAEESAEQALNNGLRDEADPNDYNDVWRWNTISTPELDIYRKWYDGGKVWPDDIELTPRTLKHWYVGDGHLEKRGNSVRMSISVSNEKSNQKKLLNYFDTVPIPVPKFNQSQIRWTVSETEMILDYMGEPLPGFEYKWP